MHFTVAGPVSTTTGANVSRASGYESQQLLLTLCLLTNHGQGSVLATEHLATSLPVGLTLWPLSTPASKRLDVSNRRLLALGGALGPPVALDDVPSSSRMPRHAFSSLLAVFKALPGCSGRS